MMQSDKSDDELWREQKEFRVGIASDLGRAFAEQGVDIVFAPDGIESFQKARERRLVYEGLNVASLRDIIASKRVANPRKTRTTSSSSKCFVRSTSASTRAL